MSCPSVPATQRGGPKKEDFQDYRLGNVIDKWWSYRVNFGGTLQRKYDQEFPEVLGFAPQRSFAGFLFDNRNKGLVRGTFGHYWGTEYEEIAMAFWLYSYEAISVILQDFRPAIQAAIRNYVQEIGYELPEIPEGTCVVHYRLGDFLTVGVLDPNRMAEALQEWADDKGLIIQRFHILASGVTAHSLDHAESIKSIDMLQSFTSKLSVLFEGAPIFMDSNGSPDDDWFKMVRAPMLFTSHGSYALSAAAASDGIRATPSVADAGAPDCTGRSYIPDYSPGWALFQCVNGYSAWDRVILMPDKAGPDLLRHDVTRCAFQSTEYVCAVVKAFTVQTRRQASPHPRCLGGKHSWGICTGGKFLCRWPFEGDGGGRREGNSSGQYRAGIGNITDGSCFIGGVTHSCVVTSHLDGTGKTCLDDDASGGICPAGSLLCAI